MKHVLCVLLCALPIALSAQPAIDNSSKPYTVRYNTAREKLYFIPTRDTGGMYTGKVVTQSDKLIIRPGMVYITSDYDVPEIELTGNFDLLDTGRQAQDAMHYNYSLCTFNNEGRFLYHPYWYDNGPDYWIEGRRRFVEGGRMGLINRHGVVVVAAKDYTYLQPQTLGLIVACYDCEYTITNSTDQEHGWGYDGGNWQLLNAQGKRLQKLNKTDLPKHIADYYALAEKNADKLAAPDAQQKRLAALLMALPETTTFKKEAAEPKTVYRYVCYEIPSKESPYYHFGLEDVNKIYPTDVMQFLISRNGKKILHISADLNVITPYAEWRKIKNRNGR